MYNFKSFLFLIESKVDDLESKHPNVPVRQYASLDSSPTKKFLPWLVNQHKLGNVTPDHPDVKSVLDNYEKYKSRHGIKDHTQHSFQEVADRITPLLGTASTNKEQKQQEIHSGVETIHTEPSGISAHFIRTKEASQHLYGGGNERGGEHGGARGTSWCVSARSEDCLFGKRYGSMYTIHVPNDDNAPYAVHPHTDTITDRHNNRPVSFFKTRRDIPHLKNSIDNIEQHYVNNLNSDESLLYKYKNPDKSLVTEDDIYKGLKSSNAEVKLAAIGHPQLNANHIDYILSNYNNNNDKYGVFRRKALESDKVTENHINYVMNNETDDSDNDGKNIRKTALSNRNATSIQLLDAIKKYTKEGHRSIRERIIGHPNATKELLQHVLKHEPNFSGYSDLVRTAEHRLQYNQFLQQ